MVVLDVVVQQAGLPKGLAAVGCRTLEGVVVQFDGEDGRGLVLYYSVHWEKLGEVQCLLVFYYQIAS